VVWLSGALVLVLTVVVVVAWRRSRHKRHQAMIAATPHLTLAPRAHRDSGPALRVVREGDVRTAPRPVSRARLPQAPNSVISDDESHESWVSPAGRHDSQWALARSLTRSRVSWPAITVTAGVVTVIVIMIVAGVAMGHHR
jgi:hypothetical protein